MKKILLTVMAAVTCILSANGQARMTLHEEFTGENCPPCNSTNPGFWALCDASTNTSKLIHITYMVPIPSSGPYYMETQTMNDARSAYYSVPFAPYGRYDGAVPDPTCGSPAGASAGHPACLTQGDIDAEAAITSPITITATHHFNTAHDSVFGKVVIHAVTAIGGTQLKLRAAFTKSMNFVTAPGTNSEKDFEHVVRAMFPDYSGQTVTSLAAGATKIYTYSGKITGMETTVTNFTVPDSAFVIWVQNDSTGKSILQAAKSTYNANWLNVNEMTSSVGMNIYPNPAKETTTVSFTLDQASTIQLKVVDQLGRIVSNVVQNMSAGTQNIAISTKTLASGIYSVILQAGSETVTEKLSVIR
jgi:hypothetical protein